LHHVIKNEKLKPTSFYLQQNFPNPFNIQTHISCILAQKSRNKIDILNISGRHVDTLINATQSAGEHSVCWHAKNNRGNDLPSGLFLSPASRKKDCGKTISFVEIIK
jgi:flagellar hook assembly protein FlgD